MISIHFYLKTWNEVINPSFILGDFSKCFEIGLYLLFSHQGNVSSNSAELQRVNKKHGPRDFRDVLEISRRVKACIFSTSVDNVLCKIHFFIVRP